MLHIDIETFISFQIYFLKFRLHLFFDSFTRIRLNDLWPQKWGKGVKTKAKSGDSYLLVSGHQNNFFLQLKLLFLRVLINFYFTCWVPASWDCPNATLDVLSDFFLSVTFGCLDPCSAILFSYPLLSGHRLLIWSLCQNLFK